MSLLVTMSGTNGKAEEYKITEWEGRGVQNRLVKRGEEGKEGEDTGQDSHLLVQKLSGEFVNV